MKRSDFTVRLFSILTGLLSFMPLTRGGEVLWDYVYEAITLPNEPWDENSPHFLLVNRTGDGKFQVSENGILKVTAITGNVAFGLPQSAQEWNQYADETTVEWRLRVEPDKRRWAQSINFAVGKHFWRILYGKNEVFILGGGEAAPQPYKIDTSLFHTWRFTIDRKTNVGTLYVDSKPIPVFQIAGLPDKRFSGIVFGMLGPDQHGTGFWDFLRWTQKGIFPPNHQ